MPKGVEVQVLSGAPVDTLHEPAQVFAASFRGGNGGAGDRKPSVPVDFKKLDSGPRAPLAPVSFSGLLVGFSPGLFRRILYR